ncbi:DUF4286 family protein [Larkinella insperata]|uniref:DUF4286 family protein n=1 Tax=Larkinella insperata TaxID=332158 RepID=A0ABW3Q4U6_9BACT|nr:DUF4286 family protein [Larkinella insperata]
MILYNLTVNIDKGVEREWLKWMRGEHIPAVMATGLPQEYKVLHLLTEIDNNGATYTFQYTFSSKLDFFRFQKYHSDELLGQIQQRYGNQHVTFQSLLEEV